MTAAIGRVTVRAIGAMLGAAALSGLALSAAACRPETTTPAPVELRVSAAVSLTESLQKIGAEFERTHGTRVRLNLAGSNTLATQIVEGADVDVFVSADSAQMDRVEQAGRVRGDTRVNLLSNTLVVLVAADRPGTPQQPRDLLDASIRRVAIGDPAAVPAGVYARQYFESAGVWDTLQPKLVNLPHVRAVAAAIASGAADAGVVYRTDARVASGTRIAWEVQPDQGPPIVYPAAVLQGTTHLDAARELVRFLQSPAATKIFAEAGFSPVVLGTADAR